MNKETKKKYEIIMRYVDKEEDHTTIYYIVKKINKRKKINKKKGLTIDEILKLDPFEDEVVGR